MKSPLILFFCGLITIQCSNAVRNSTPDIFNIRHEVSPPFKITAVTADHWIAGMPQGGSGVEVTIELEKPYPLLEKIYFNNNQSKIIYPSSLSNPNYSCRIFIDPKSDDLTLHRDTKMEYTNSIPIPIPLLKDQMALVYTFKGKRFYTLLNPKKTITPRFSSPQPK